MFPKTEYVLECQKGVEAQFPVAAIPENISNF
jgi:hypothetical protein